MTTGIYKLNFDNTTQVYIGKSKNIRVRFRAHRTCMQKGIAAKKLQHAYDTYGLPTIEVLCECSENELNKYEKEAIEIFNPVANGFNTQYADSGIGISSKYGEDASFAYYDNETYIEIADLLANTTNTTIDIANTLNVSENVVRQIKQMVNHSWLANVVPKNYSRIKQKLELYRSEGMSAKYQGKTYASVVSPDGIEYNIDNINKFGREHKLDSGNLCKLLNGEYIYYKGWRLSTTPKKTPIKLISPLKEIFILENISVLQFSKQHNLDNSSVSKLAKGTVPQYKGWKLYSDE
jgi:hypothetical protein